MDLRVSITGLVTGFRPNESRSVLPRTQLEGIIKSRVANFAVACRTNNQDQAPVSRLPSKTLVQLVQFDPELPTNQQRLIVEFKDLKFRGDENLSAAEIIKQRLSGVTRDAYRFNDYPEGPLEESGVVPLAIRLAEHAAKRHIPDITVELL